MAYMGRRRDPREKIPTRDQKDLIRQNIAAALKERHNMVLDGDKIDGVDVGVKLNDERAGDGFSRRYNGKVRVQIGGNAYQAVEQKGYPQRKDGTHSYDKIADELARMKEIVEAWRKAKSASNAKYERAKAFIQEQADGLGVNWYSLPLDADHRSGSLNLKLTGLTEGQAGAFLRLADELGLIRR